MNLEINRLRTFSTWPTNTPIEPRVAANCGFFATGNFLEAECNWCHRRIRDWEYGDQVEDRHRLAEPQCIFLINYVNCGNIPIDGYSSRELPTTSGLASVGSPQHSSHLLVEANRLATFKNWPNPNISPQSLAKAGFFYLNRSDEVKCAWCKGVIAKWEKQDNAFKEHQRFFPDCPRVQLGPLIEMASEGIRDLGIHQITPPKRPKFSSLDARLRSYTNWPISNVQRPEALAQAGLYYQNIDDQVRCFHCNIGLRSWQKTDDPWFEHAKWFPQCQFVRLVKGANYVQQVEEITRQTSQEMQETNCGTTMTIEEAMTTAAVVQALEIGIDAGSIRNVTQRKLLATGRPYDTVEDLVKAVFGDREDEDTIQEGDSASEGEGAEGSIVREVSRIITNIFNSTERGEASAEATDTTAVLGGSAEPEHQCQRHVPFIPTNLDAVGTAAAAVTSAATNNETASEVKTEIKTEKSDDIDEVKSLEEENRKLKDARLCKICLDDEVGVVFLPCGHLVTCVQCAAGVDMCPMCRTNIKGFIRTFLS